MQNMTDEEILAEQQATRRSALAGELEKQLKMSFATMLEANIDAIAAELLMASDGQSGVGFRFGLALQKDAVGLTGKVSWHRKFEDKDERTFQFNDPTSPKLPGIE